MNINRPLWYAGVLLNPQQFQHQARQHDWYNACTAQLAQAHPWGVLAARFDVQALRQGTLKAEHLAVRLEDGTLLDSERADLLPPALPLANVEGECLQVVVALPREHANGANCVFEGQRPAQPTRYRQGWNTTRDLYGEDSLPLAIMLPQWELRDAGAQNADYLCCPVARLARSEGGGWALDEHFVPPLLQLAAHPPLQRQLALLLDQLRAKCRHLMGLRRESNQRLADFAVADVSLFWMLTTLNSHEPLLADLANAPQQHPHRLWQVLAGLAGSLMTFSLEHSASDLPAYDHNNLSDVLPQLLALVGTLLEAGLPSRVVAVPLEGQGHNRWQARLADPRLREPGKVALYLSVRSPLPAAELQVRVPQLVKVAHPDQMNRLVNAALDGIALQPQVQVPAALPLRLENQYFQLGLDSAEGRDMLAHGTCAFYVAGPLAEAGLELFAVVHA